MIIREYTIKVMLRNFSLSFLLILLPLILMLIIGVYQQLISTQQTRINDINNSIPISITLTDFYSAQSDRLFIPNNSMSLFTNDTSQLYNYIEDVRLKRTIEVVLIEDAELINDDGTVRLIGLTFLDADRSLAPENGVVIELSDLFDESIFRGNEELCLLTDDILRMYGKEIGDMIWLGARSTFQSEWNEPTVVSRQFKIAGVIYGKNKSIYCPWIVLNDIASESDISGYMYSESMSAKLADNHLLENFRELASNYFYIEMTSDISQKFTFSLTIDDNIYLESLKKATRDYRLLTYLKPVLFLLAGGLAVITAFLYTKDKPKEIKTMRSLGIKPSLATLAITLGFLIPTIFGITVGVIICIALKWINVIDITVITGIIAIYFLVSLAGVLRLAIQNPLREVS